MSFILTCPNCGPRRVDEFRFGGEYRSRPEGELSAREWGAYLYERANIAGSQQEWWYHRHGCKRWFIATRDTVTNTVLSVAWVAPREGAQHVEKQDSPTSTTAGNPGARPG